MNQLNIVTQIAINQWVLTTNHATKLLNQMPDEILDKQVAINKNTGKYIMGHLIALHDALPQILGIGESAHPELTEIYLKKSDGLGDNPKTVPELRTLWTETHERVTGLIKELPEELWLARHNAMTDDDFEANPLRNRLSVLISRTHHFHYHLGQLRLSIP